MTSTTIALSKLYIAKENVRKTDRELDIAPLADDIAVHGLLQPLVVIPGKIGRFGVVAGGRRLLALDLLKQRGALPHDWPVPVVHKEQAEGREVSLAENLHKVAMNPADELEAYQAIVADYADRGEADPAARIERCARHFGKTVRHVEERLRLAALAPEILDALRDGRLALDAAKLYAAYPDQQLQRDVWEALERQAAGGVYRAHTAAAIRAALAGKVYRLGDRQVRYVGAEAYLAAGGRIERELFMGSADEEVLLDTALLDRLCTEKADAEAGRLALAAGFTGGSVQPWGAHSYSSPKPPSGWRYEWRGTNCLQAEPKNGRIACYQIAADGAGLELTGGCFEPIAARPDEARPGASGPAAAASSQAGTRPAWESELDRLARIRRERIELRALRLAAPPIAGTPLQDRAFWPSQDDRTVPAIAQADDGDFIVAILVKVAAADVAAARAAAERAVDSEDAGQPLPDPAERDAEWSASAPALADEFAA